MSGESLANAIALRKDQVGRLGSIYEEDPPSMMRLEDEWEERGQTNIGLYPKYAEGPTIFFPIIHI